MGVFIEPEPDSVVLSRYIDLPVFKCRTFEGDCTLLFIVPDMEHILEFDILITSPIPSVGLLKGECKNLFQIEYLDLM